MLLLALIVLLVACFCATAQVHELSTCLLQTKVKLESRGESKARAKRSREGQGPTRVLPLGDSITMGVGDGCLFNSGQTAGDYVNGRMDTTGDGVVASGGVVANGSIVAGGSIGVGDNMTRDGHVSISRNLSFGDNITLGLSCLDESAGGVSCSGGYRTELWRKLSPGSATSDRWDFVGTLQNGLFDIDRDHEGHDGWKTEDALYTSDKWLLLAPDVILMDLGTNNLDGDQNASEALGHMSDLLNLTFTALPRVRVLLATIGGSALMYAAWDRFSLPHHVKYIKYNKGLKTMAAELSSQGWSIELVDMFVESGLRERCLMDSCCSDHPNRNGYKLMADVWYSHLV